MSYVESPVGDENTASGRAEDGVGSVTCITWPQLAAACGLGSAVGAAELVGCGGAGTVLVGAGGDDSLGNGLTGLHAPRSSPRTETASCRCTTPR